MMKNIPFDAVHHSPMQRHNELGDLIADLLDFRIVILHSGGGQFKSGNKGRDRVDIKTNHPGVAAHGLHQTCPAADEGIENDSAMHGGLSEIGIPKGVGLVRGKGQRGDDRTELRAHPACKPAVDPVQRIRALTFTQGKLGDVARLQQGTGRPTAKGVTSAVFNDLLCLTCFSHRAPLPSLLSSTAGYIRTPCRTDPGP
ncbi:hypothetical protein SDC9_150449 [bioreactor metagenome]|uniref:Uncharacterized protein n=1 Tax=bioreactor metagenome TaxID=1076179 RepID=A0A645ERR2_9ZZZZ